MTLYAAINPYPVILNQVGGGLNGGAVYIGLPGQDPQTFPAAIFWDEAGTIPAAQPLTTIGGYIWNAGTPAQVYGPAPYSIRVRDRFGAQVFHTPRANSFPADLGSGASNLGAGLIGASHAATYASGTLGHQSKDFISAGDAPFNVVGDGVTSDNVAMAALATYINALPNGGAVYIGRRQIVIDGVTVTFTKSVKFIGDGPEVSQIHFKNGGRIICDGGVSTLYHSDQFAFDGVRFLCLDNHSSSPLRIQYTSQVGQTIPSFDFQRTEIACQQTTGNFVNGLELHNCTMGTLHGIRVEGSRAFVAPNPLPSVCGVNITDDARGSDIVFDEPRIFYVRTAIKVRGLHEGLRVYSPTFVGVILGVDWDGTGVDGFNPLFVLSGGHINAEGSSVKLKGVVEAIITDTDFYGQGADATTTELIVLDIDPGFNGGLRLNLRILGNMFQGDANFGEPGARVSTAIRIRGNVGDSEQCLIANNQFQSYDIGVQLDANVGDVTVCGSNTFANVTTPVINNGSGNIIAGSVVAAQAASFTDDSGFAMRMGSAVVTLNASGDGSIPLSPAFSSVFAAAMVNNGDAALSGSAAFVCNYAASTTSQISVSVRPNPGAGNVRANFVAFGK